MFAQDTIRKRVMKEISARLAEGEKEYKEECDEIDREATQKKSDAADKIVKRILP